MVETVGAAVEDLAGAAEGLADLVADRAAAAALPEAGEMFRKDCS